MISNSKTFFILVLITILLVCNGVGQKDSKAKQSLSADEKQRRQFIREQAILLLKDVLLNSKTISDRFDRADLTAEAAITLWDHDKAFAKDFFNNSISNFLKDYKKYIDGKDSESADEEREIAVYSLKTHINALAKRDLAAADEFQKQFFAIKSKEISDLPDKDINERFKMALEAEDLDLQKSVMLISQIIEVGVPDGFPKFIFNLKSKNSVLADTLFSRAVNNLATKPHYTSRDAILLSVYAFNENGVVLPYFDGNQLDNFGIFTTTVKNNQSANHANLSRSFLLALQRYLNLRLQNQADGRFNTPNNLLQTYFVLKKAEFYSLRILPNTQSVWRDFQISISSLAQDAGINSQILTDVSGYAERLATSNNPLNLDDGTGAFEKAEKSNDPREKMLLQIQGIIQLIERNKFDEAEKKIFDLPIEEVRSQLTLFLNTRAALSFIETKDWSNFDGRLNKISDAKIKAFLHLKTLTSSKQHTNTFLAEHLTEAKKNLLKVEDKTFKTAGYFAMTAYLLSINNSEAPIVFLDALQAINESPEYRHRRPEINLKIPGQETYFAYFLERDDFQLSFQQLAKSAWENSQVYAVQIKNSYLKTLAQISAAKAVLN